MRNIMLTQLFTFPADKMGIGEDIANLDYPRQKRGSVVQMLNSNDLERNAGSTTPEIPTIPDDQVGSFFN